MASIFVSHSRKDEMSNIFFHKVFSLTPVQAIFFEFDATHTPPPGPAIEQQIKAANALFIVLGPNAARLPHTRSWINWEAGIASAIGREIWVFEPFPPQHDLPIPKLNHYVVFGDDDAWLHYVRLIVGSYDGSVIPGVIAGGAAGAGLGQALKSDEDDEGTATLFGAAAGALLGALLTSQGAKSRRPLGNTIRCPNLDCQMMFQAHTWLETFPCPACRQLMSVSWAYQP